MSEPAQAQTSTPVIPGEDEPITLAEACRFLPPGWSVPALKHAARCRALPHEQIGHHTLVTRIYLREMLESGLVNGIVGDIYFVGFGKYLKIGFTRSGLDQRLKAMRTYCPEPLVVYGTIRGTTRDESHLHRRFARYRLRNEWFRLAGWLKRYVSQLPHEAP